MTTYNLLIDRINLLLADNPNHLILKGVTTLLSNVYVDGITVQNLKVTVTNVKEGKLIKCEVNGDV